MWFISKDQHFQAKSQVLHFEGRKRQFPPIVFVLAARHHAAITTETQLQVWFHSEPSNAKVHVWSPCLHFRPGSLHSYTSSFWGADKHFRFVRGHCAPTQLWPFSKKPSTQLQISKADFTLLDVEHKLYYNLWGKSSPSSNLQMLFWAVHILKYSCSLIDLLGWNCSDICWKHQISKKIPSTQKIRILS